MGSSMHDIVTFSVDNFNYGTILWINYKVDIYNSAYNFGAEFIITCTKIDIYTKRVQFTWYGVGEKINLLIKAI